MVLLDPMPDSLRVDVPTVPLLFIWGAASHPHCSSLSQASRLTDSPSMVALCPPLPGLSRALSPSPISSLILNYWPSLRVPKDIDSVPLCLPSGWDVVIPPFRGLSFPDWGIVRFSLIALSWWGGDHKYPALSAFLGRRQGWTWQPWMHQTGSAQSQEQRSARRPELNEEVKAASWLGWGLQKSALSEFVADSPS